MDPRDVLTIRLCNDIFSFHRKYLGLSPKLVKLVEEKTEININFDVMSNIIAWGKLFLANQSRESFFNNLHRLDICAMANASTLLDMKQLNDESRAAVMSNNYRPDDKSEYKKDEDDREDDNSMDGLIYVRDALIKDIRITKKRLFVLEVSLIAIDDKIERLKK